MDSLHEEIVEVKWDESKGHADREAPGSIIDAETGLSNQEEREEGDESSVSCQAWNVFDLEALIRTCFECTGIEALEEYWSRCRVANIDYFGHDKRCGRSGRKVSTAWKELY